MFNTRLTSLRMGVLCACVLLLGLLTGCGGGSSSASGNNPVTSTSRTSNGLQFTLSANKSRYAIGEVVQITLSVKNTSAQPITIAPSNYALPDAIFKAIQNNQVSWTSPQGGASGNSGLSNPNFMLAAGQTQATDVKWYQTSDVTNQQVAPGTYTLQAYLTTASVNGVPFTPEQAQASLAASPIQITIHN